MNEKIRGWLIDYKTICKGFARDSHYNGKRNNVAYWTTKAKEIAKSLEQLETTMSLEREGPWADAKIQIYKYIEFKDLRLNNPKRKGLTYSCFNIKSGELLGWIERYTELKAYQFMAVEDSAALNSNELTEILDFIHQLNREFDTTEQQADIDGQQ